MAASLKVVALRGLEKSINEFLRLDPDMIGRVAQLKNKTIAVEFQNLGLVIYFVSGPNGFRLTDSIEGDADTVLTGTPLALLRAGITNDQQNMLFEGDIRISGDTEVGQQFRDLLQSVDIDWEEHVSHLVGDVVAHKLGHFTRELVGWSAETSNSLNQSISEYLLEESMVLPRKDEVNKFLSDVDKIRDDVERIEQRISRLRTDQPGEAE
ncbi:MAG: SCP2 domain-containing protein [Gammaproteobacteria bacterium]